MPSERMTADQWNARQRAANPKMARARDAAIARERGGKRKLAAMARPVVDNRPAISVAHLSIPGHPPSVNAHRLGVKADWREVKAYRLVALPLWRARRYGLRAAPAYHFTLVLYGRMSGDLSNRIKAAEDVAAEALGYNDRLNARVTVERGSTDGAPWHSVTVEVAPEKEASK